MSNKQIFTCIMAAALAGSVLFSGCSKTNESSPTSSADASASSTVSADAKNSADGVWPNKAINLIVPTGAGGGTDTNARLVAKYLSEELGQPVTVTNIGGSSGALGLKEAKNAANDGYTFVYFNEDTVTNWALGVMDFGYQDLEMIGNVFKVDMFLVGNSDIPDVATLKQKAEEKPGEVVFGGESSAFISLLPYIINEKLGIDLKIVDGGQMSERLPLMVGKQIDLTFAPMIQIKDYLTTGDLCAIALINDQRSEKAPDVLTSVEQGLDIVYNRFQCIMGPKGIDPKIVEKFSQALKAVSENPDFIKDADANGITVAYTDPAGVRKLMEDYSIALENYMQYVPKK